MLRLTTLGALRLTTSATSRSPHPLLGQPKRLALLVYLTMAGPGCVVFRDTLLAMLWPDWDEGRARRALRQTLLHLRRALGADLVLGPSAQSVAVESSRLWCDAVELERALLEDRPESVLELYGGDFLPGFHPDCGSAFEQWLEEVRGRLRRKATVAAATLAQSAEAGGEIERAVGHARRLVDLRPLDEAAARLLIRLFARAGNRAAAREAYRDLASRLQRELDLEPDPQTLELIAVVKAGATDGLERPDHGASRRLHGPRGTHDLVLSRLHVN